MGREARARRKAFVESHVEPVRACPNCRAELNAATSTTLDAQPDAARTMTVGDVSVCAYCSAILVVTDAGFRLATQAEFDQLDPVLRRLVSTWTPIPEGAP